MSILYIIFTFISFSLLFVFLTFSFLVLRIFTGKSIRNPIYPPVKGTVFNQLFYFNRLYDYQTKAAKEHPTFRFLAPAHSDIYTTDTRNVEHVLKTNFSKYSIGKYNLDVVTDIFGKGIFVVDGEKWKKQRKLASFQFSARVIRDFSSSVFRRNAAKLVRAVFEISGATQSFDMQDILMRCTLDSIFKVGFGLDLNCLEGSSKEGTEFRKAFDGATALVYCRFLDPFWKLKRSLNIGSEAALRKNYKVIDDFVHQLIRSKRKLIEGKTDANDEDILSRFLLESEKDPDEMNDAYLRDVILNFMIAGKDTSANALSWFLYMLCKNPLIQEKVAQEVRDVVGTIQVGEANIDELAANITDANLEKMHYLHAAITETLRLYPSVPVDGRCAEVDDILPDGFRVRKGDGVYYMAYAMGRMPYIWGEDAEDFRPERWLNNGIFVPESPFKFVAFHGGPRSCLGKDFAYRQMKIVTMALLFFFRLKLADETKNVTYRTMFTLHMDGGLPLHAIPRTD